MVSKLAIKVTTENEIAATMKRGDILLLQLALHDCYKALGELSRCARDYQFIGLSNEAAAMRDAFEQRMNALTAIQLKNSKDSDEVYAMLKRAQLPIP